MSLKPLFYDLENILQTFYTEKKQLSRLIKMVEKHGSLEIFLDRFESMNRDGWRMAATISEIAHGEVTAEKAMQACKKALSELV